MYNIDYNFIKSFLLEGKRIIITTHKTPDGDALGSSLALFHILKQHHNVIVIVPNEYPKYLSWLPGSESVIIYEDNEIKSNKLIEEADLVFCLDFNKLSRLDSMQHIVKKSQAYKIMIDHHEDPDDFCNQVLSNSSVCSTAELMYDFLFTLDYKVNTDIAICLYTGIITDTGSLKFPNVTQKTHQIVTKLMGFPINHSIIHQNLFDQQNKSRLELLKICLENLTLFKNEHAALIFLREKDLLKCNYVKGDTEGFVNMPLSLININFSAFFIEFKDCIKISFRSQGDFDVNLFSKTYFNGGGHKNASGGIVKGKNIEDSIKYFAISLKDFLNVE